MLTGRLEEAGHIFPKPPPDFLMWADGASFQANRNARIERLRLFPPPF